MSRPPDPLLFGMKTKLMTKDADPFDPDDVVKDAIRDIRWTIEHWAHPNGKYRLQKAFEKLNSII